MSGSGNPEKIAYLDFIGEDNNPCRLEIKGPIFSIGRGYNNDLRIADSSVSRNHAEIVRTDDGRFLMRDKESKGGSFVNGDRIEVCELKSGDEIVLGRFRAAKLTFGYMTRWSETSTLDTEEMQRSLDPNFLYQLRGATVITDQQTRFLNTELMRRPDYVTETTLQRLTSLYEITHKLLPVQGIKELAETWIDALLKALPVERGVIVLENPLTAKFEIIASRDVSKLKDKDERRSKSGAHLKASSTIIEQVFENNVAVLINDASSDARFADLDSVIMENIHSVICAPISSKLRVWGVCYLDSPTKASVYNSEDLEFLMATAREAGLVIENLRLIEELRATQEQLIKSDRLATIGKLASSISHELRNRLALLTGAEFIAMKYGNDPEVQQFVDMVLTGQRRALELVEEIRAFARNQTEEYEKERRAIVPVIEKAVSILRLDPSVMRCYLDFNYDCSPELFFNEGKIEQVLINLIRNAAEAMPASKGKINVVLTSENGEALINVIDNGTGIPPELMKHIWEPFFTTKGEEGTGLGLEICRRIIEAHGGLITCESKVGEGSRFTIRLPLE